MFFNLSILELFISSFISEEEVIYKSFYWLFCYNFNLLEVCP